MTDEELIKHRKRIGERIAQIRKEQKLSTYQLAEMTGLQASNITRIEKGHYSTGVDILSRICSALGKGIDIVDIV